MAKFKVKNDLQELSLDLLTGQVKKYSTDEANDILRNAIIDACGGEFNRYTYMDNKGKVFAILAETLQVAVGYTMYEKFSELADFHNVALGDTIKFKIEDTSLFKVYTTSKGNRDIDRQKLYGEYLTVSTERIAVKIYEELDRMLSGRINWSTMIQRVADSMSYEIGKRIYNAVYGAYDIVSAPYKASMSGTFSASALETAIAHVEASTGRTAKVLGTKSMLGKITDAEVTDEMKNTKNKLGHYGVFRGTALEVLPQGHIAGTDNFAVSDGFLIVVPDGEKIVKVITEGETIVDDKTTDGNRNDEQVEFYMGENIGVAAIKSKSYAILRLA